MKQACFTRGVRPPPPAGSENGARRPGCGAGPRGVGRLWAFFFGISWIGYRHAAGNGWTYGDGEYTGKTPRLRPNPDRVSLFFISSLLILISLSACHRKHLRKRSPIEHRPSSESDRTLTVSSSTPGEFMSPVSRFVALIDLVADHRPRYPSSHSCHQSRMQQPARVGHIEFERDS